MPDSLKYNIGDTVLFTAEGRESKGFITGKGMAMLSLDNTKAVSMYNWRLRMGGGEPPFIWWKGGMMQVLSWDEEMFTPVRAMLTEKI